MFRFVCLIEICVTLKLFIKKCQEEVKKSRIKKIPIKQNRHKSRICMDKVVLVLERKGSTIQLPHG